MNLFESLLTVILNLMFFAMDILISMILVRQIYQRWHPEYLRSFAEAFEPMIEKVLSHFSRLVCRVTKKTFSRRTTLVLLVMSMVFFRLFVLGVF